jgi:hypothetical protein
MNDINKNISANRGIDFLLSGRRKENPNISHIFFKKIICFFYREITINFNFSIDVRKKK